MERNQGRLRILVALAGVLVAAVLLVAASASASPEHSPAKARTPVVMFPAYFFTTLRITVHHQRVAPECPRSGSFRVFFLNDEPTAFSRVCQMKLLTLRYDRKRAKPMS